MKVAIDVLSQSPAAASGVLSLYIQLARFLPERDPETQYLFFAGHNDAAYYQSKSDKVRVVPVGWGNRYRLRRLLSEHFLLGPALAREGVDVIFHSGIPPLLLPGKGKLIMGVWALHHLAQSDITVAQRVYRRAMFARSLKRADICLVNSEYTKSILMEHYRDFAAPVKVIRHGVDLALFNPEPLSDRDIQSLGRAGVKLPFVLFVGLIYPYKQLHILAEAFCIAMKQSRLPHQLVVVGSFAKFHGMGEEYRDRIVALMRKYDMSDRLVLAEDVNIRDLRALYAGADVYVQPSSAETFGRTVIESMACGCPVVAANAAATPEILGDAGLYYRYDDVEGCATQMLRVLEDDVLRANLVARGLDRVQEFSFDNEVRQLVTLFHQTHEGRL